MFSSLTATLLFRLVEGVRVCRASHLVTFQSEGAEPLHVPVQTDSLADALVALVGPGIAWHGMASLAARESVAWISQTLEACLDLLSRSQMLELVWVADGMERAVITALGPGFRFSGTPLCFDSEVVLSRFAYVRRFGGRIVLESPEALCRVEFTCLQTWYSVGLLAQPTSIFTLLRRGQNDSAELARLLWSTGFLELSDSPESANRASWEFHDLLFHWRTRAGRVKSLQGGTFRFLGKWEPPPAIKAPMSAESIPLPIPAATPEGSDLVTVIERRRSVRDQGEPLISMEQIARLLYHTARVQQSLPGDYQELLLRPVPSAGAIHEIELYLAVGQCDGVKRGLYHYHAQQHALYRLPAREDELEALLKDAALSWAKPYDPPQILVILTSRFPRLAWKYEGIAYRLTLLNAGVIIQSLYLLATDMGLACAAIGGGDSEVFAAASGLDPLNETSIAEFAFGSPVQYGQERA